MRDVWEAYQCDPAGFDPSVWPRALLPPLNVGPSQSELVALALTRSADFGDPNPENVSLARGSRFEVTATTGSTVFDDAPSWIVVTEGRYSAQNAPRPGLPSQRPATVSFRFHHFVVDIATGNVTDSGGAGEPPDLSQLSDVVHFDASTIPSSTRTRGG